MNPVSSEDDLQRIEYYKAYIQHSLSDISSYHNHKESVTYIGVLVQMGLFAAIMTMQKWPLEWIPNNFLFLSREVWAFIGFLSLWILIHIFIRWQLRKRRWAVLRNNALVITARGWVTKQPPTERDLELYIGSGNPAKVRTFIDRYIFPCSSAEVPDDIGLNGEPGGLADIIEEQEVPKDVIGIERLLAIGSFVILALVLFRTFWGVGP